MRRSMFLGLAGLLLAACPSLVAADERPNVLLILVDDLGRETLASYGGMSYRTPNLDRLARDGLRFENCYATPLCAPTRTEILTGCYSFRNYTTWGDFPDDQTTFARLLKKAGYATGFAGKWQLGGWDQTPPRLVRKGFDEYISYDAFRLLDDSKRRGGNRYWGGTIVRNGEPVRLDRYGPDVYSDFIIDFMRKHRDGPFLAYYCMTLMHRPFHPTSHHPDAPQPGQQIPADWLTNRGEGQNFEAMLTHVDEIVGKLLAALDELQLSENTIVIFTSDNGTDNKGEAKSIRSAFQGQNVRGGKYFPTELGANVPLIIRWPGKVAAGQTTKALVDFTDILPTFCDLADAPLEQDQACDGRSLKPLFNEPHRPHKPFIYTWGDFEHNSRQYKHPADYADKLLHVVRDDRWKLYSDGRLFDLHTDFLENTPLTPNETAETKAAYQRLQRQLETLRDSPPKRW